VLSVAIAVAVTLGCALVQSPSAEAVSASAKTKFIASMVTAAQNTQRKFGVPASVSMAQAIVASDWGTSSAVDKAKNYFDTPCSGSMTAAQFAKLAEAQVGKPYVLGAEAAITNPNPPKFDCSELVQWLYGRSGNTITDLAAAQYNVTKKVASGDSPKVGDLVFLRNNPARSNGIGHVAVLTKKRSDGDWEIIEARGRAYGVVKTTLSYWKQRSYYAGLRRYASFVLVNGDSVTASAAGDYKTKCLKIGSTTYSAFSSMTNSFYANAAAITEDSAYKDARAVLSSVPKLVNALAKVVKPKSADDYADTLNKLIDTYHLTDYDIVPIGIVLVSGNTGSKVTALQHLLKAAGQSVTVTGKYDAKTVAAVKKFQKAKKLESDGEAGQYTLTALFSKLTSGTSGASAQALNALLDGLGYATTAGNDFGSATLAAVKSFQTTAGRGATGTVDPNTWAALFMALDSQAPKISGTTRVGQTLNATVDKWGPGTVALDYRWQRNGAAISGADGDSYTLKAEDAGKTLTVVVTGTKAGYTVTSRSSAATKEIESNTLGTAPVPTVKGTARVGQKLTATAGTWKPAPVTLAYQWLRDGTAIAGATKSTYTVQAADVDAKLSVTVTGTKAGYESASKTSAETDKVAKGTLTGKKPLIHGTRNVGVTLTLEVGTWSPSGVKLSYQWYRGDTAIKGATKTKYKLTKSDKGKQLTVVVKGTKDGYETLELRSAKTRKVTS
jgi:peptidoglycan hydrolase-like protein with peptidoglycan-binding domain/cell wall-associated NlpC family hydrolase